MEFYALAAKSIAGQCLSRQECKAVLDSNDDQILEVLGAAYRVRREFCGNKVHVHVLMNAKSGLCPEDCNYCSQSKLSTAEISKYPMVAREKLLDGAMKAKKANAKRFCIVASGRGPTWPEVSYLSEVVREIRDSVDIKICCSVGLLTEDKAKVFKEAGVDQLNHNLNTSETFYPQICSTHTYQDRVDTLLAARSAGIESVYWRHIRYGRSSGRRDKRLARAERSQSAVHSHQLSSCDSWYAAGRYVESYSL